MARLCPDATGNSDSSSQVPGTTSGRPDESAPSIDWMPGAISQAMRNSSTRARACRASIGGAKRCDSSPLTRYASNRVFSPRSPKSRHSAMPGCQSVVSAAQRSAHRTAFTPRSAGATRSHARSPVARSRCSACASGRKRSASVGELMRRSVHPWLQRYGRATNTQRERLPTAPRTWFFAAARPRERDGVWPTVRCPRAGGRRKFV